MPNTPKPKKRVRRAQERMNRLADTNPILAQQRRIPNDTRNIPQFPRGTTSTQRSSNTNTGLQFTQRGYPANWADNPAKAQADVNRRERQRSQRVAATQSRYQASSPTGVGKKKRPR